MMSRTYRFDNESQSPKFVRSISKRFGSKRAKRLPKYHTNYIEIHPSKLTSI